MKSQRARLAWDEKTNQIWNNENLIDIDGIMAATGYERGTIYNYSSEPDFPKAKGKRGPYLLFSRQEIQEWFAKRKEEQRIRRANGIAPVLR